jgi:hypothetical protein
LLHYDHTCSIGKPSDTENGAYYHLVSALQSTVCGNDIINSTGASFEFKIDGLANSLEFHFTHRQIANVYADDKEFDTICLRIIEELCKQYPDLKTHTVCRTFTMKR